MREACFKDHSEHRRSATGNPGLAVSITDLDDRLYEFASGHADRERGIAMSPDTRVQVGSVTKLWTALLCLRLRDRGRLDLDAPVAGLLAHRAGELPRGLRLHHLLSDTAGLPLGRDDVASAAALDLESIWSVHEPGRRYIPSNLGFRLVGRILQAIDERPLPELFKAEVLAPLGMTRSAFGIAARDQLDACVGYRWIEDRRPYHLEDPLVRAPWFAYSLADGAGLSTVRDLGRMARALGAGARGAERDFLSAEAWAALFHPRTERDSDCDIGLGLWLRRLDGTEAIGTGGDMPGFAAVFLASRETPIAVAAVTNGPRSPWTLVRETYLAAHTPLDERIEFPPIEDRFRIDAEPGMLGRFHAADGESIEIAACRDGLSLWLGGRSTRLAERSADLTYGCSDAGMQGDFLWTFEDGDPPRWLHGPKSFLPKPGTAPPGDLLGTFRSWQPFAPVLRLFTRGDALFLQLPATGVLDALEMPLFPLRPGVFAVGSETDPDRLEADLSGARCPLEASLNGTPYFLIE